MRYALTDVSGKLLGIIVPWEDVLAKELIRGSRLELSVEYEKQTQKVHSFIASPIPEFASPRNEIPTPNGQTFDLKKRYMHVEDNEDGTMTLTINGFDMPDGKGPVTIVVEGELDKFLLDVSFSVSKEDVEDFRNRSVIIPNEVGGGEVL